MSTSLRKLAMKIPPKVRRDRILTDDDPIHTASPQQHDPKMMLLATIWYDWVDPHGTRGYCPICLENLLKNYRGIYSELLDLEKEANILKQI